MGRCGIIIALINVMLIIVIVKNLIYMKNTKKTMVKKVNLNKCNYIYKNSLTILTPKEKTEFRRDNKNTIELSNKVGDYLIGLVS